jgi:hypothetical protein
VPERLVVFANGKFLYAGGVWLRRPDVADALGDPRYLHSGFRYSFPLELLSGLDTLDLRIFAVVDAGAAEELTYGAGYQYRKRPR